jgi:hypothetical protein
MEGFLAGLAIGMGIIGAVWFFWPTEKAALKRELDKLKAQIASLRIKP